MGLILSLFGLVEVPKLLLNNLELRRLVRKFNPTLDLFQVKWIRLSLNLDAFNDLFLHRGLCRYLQSTLFNIRNRAIDVVAKSAHNILEKLIVIAHSFLGDFVLIDTCRSLFSEQD